MDIMLQRILELIPKKHGSKKELADAIGINSNSISEWKAGRAKSYPKYAPKIAEYYCVSLDWLSGKTDRDIISTSTDDGINTFLLLLNTRIVVTKNEFTKRKESIENNFSGVNFNIQSNYQDSIELAILENTIKVLNDLKSNYIGINRLSDCE